MFVLSHIPGEVFESYERREIFRSQYMKLSLWGKITVFILSRFIRRPKYDNQKVYAQVYTENVIKKYSKTLKKLSHT